MKAWKVTYTSAPGLTAIYEAETRNQARTKAHRHVQDIQEDLRYIDIKAVRCPEWDLRARLGMSLFGCLGWTDGTDSWGCLNTQKEEVI